MANDGNVGVSESEETIGEISGSGLEDSVKHEKQLSETNGGSNGNVVNENGELHEEKQTRGAAEEALEHLQVAYEEADSKAQEVQKEKDDLEARIRDMNETTERASSQHSVLLRDDIEALCLSLQLKENALEALQRLLLEEEQMLEEMRASLQAAEEKRQASIAELSAKNQKNLESLEA
ncbi:hypothetical protein Q3G72_024849 [Acer saccharum]|nr:hypothetical protein Q3G72_024849 [Acer saccharum]